MYRKDLHFFFTGIGGSGMSGLAELMLQLGFRVSGSDARLSPTTERLQSLGALIHQGHHASHLAATVSTLVYSSAVAQDNPELVEARRLGIPVIARAEVLAELMRLKFGVAVAGSHGKTTTTSMIAHVLQCAGLDPTVVVGGQLHQAGTGARLGRGQYLVAETDESDRSFLLLKPTIAVVTNIDNEHLTAYGSTQDLEAAFQQFMCAVPFYGLMVGCIDDPTVSRLLQTIGRRTVSYGFSPDADLHAVDLSHQHNNSQARILAGDTEIGVLNLQIPGRHMICNALAAIAVGRELGVPHSMSIEALASFSGVKRRLEVIDNYKGIIVMSDYGHHPAEVRATLQAIRDGWGKEINRLRVLFQPHRYSRTKECFQDFLTAFDLADEVIITEIYAASEDAIPGITGSHLQRGLRHPASEFISKVEDAAITLAERAIPGDFILCLGAGSVGSAPEIVAKTLRTERHIEVDSTHVQPASATH